MTHAGKTATIIRIDAKHADAIADRLLDAGFPRSSIAGEEIRWLYPEPIENWFEFICDKLQKHDVFPDGDSFDLKFSKLQMLRKDLIKRELLSSENLWRIRKGMDPIPEYEESMKQAGLMFHENTSRGVTLDVTSSYLTKEKIDAEENCLQSNFHEHIRDLIKRGGLLVFGVPLGFEKMRRITPSELRDEKSIPHRYRNLQAIITSELPRSVFAQRGGRPSSKSEQKEELEREAKQFLLELVAQGKVRDKSDAHRQVKSKFGGLSDNRFRKIWSETVPDAFKKPGAKPKKDQ